MSPSSIETLGTHRQFTKKKPDWPKTHMKGCSASKIKSTVRYHFTVMGEKETSVSGSVRVGTDAEWGTLHTGSGVYIVSMSQSNRTIFSGVGINIRHAPTILLLDNHHEQINNTTQFFYTVQKELWTKCT